MITMTEYAKRRDRLMKKIDPNGVIILPSARECIRNGDVTYLFRQNSDFYYLTGFTEPDAVLVLAPHHPKGEYILFNRARDPEREQWEGSCAGQSGAKRHFLADQAYEIGQLESVLPALLAGRKMIYYPMGSHWMWDKFVLRLLRELKPKKKLDPAAPTTLTDILPLIHEMRVIKSAAEIAMIQRAVDITVDAHTSAMMACTPRMNECELEALLSYEFKSHGAMQPAYSHIVASGKDATTLHYVNNNKHMADGKLVLIDAGAEYDHYAADVTRTFPANGRFTGEQRAIYEIVLKAQLAGIRAIKPGVRWPLIQNTIVKIITTGLKELGILKGSVSDLIAKKAYLPFYMHGSGHWLGLDVHDAGSYQEDGTWRSLKPGMVLTVEPGIYISPSSRVHARWHDIGVRIEDDVLVTQAGCRVLSQDLPKTIDDIEAMMT